MVSGHSRCHRSCCSMLPACAGSQLPDRAPSEAAAAGSVAWSAGAVSGCCDARRQVTRLGGVTMTPAHACRGCTVHRWPCAVRGAAAGFRWSLAARKRRQVSKRRNLGAVQEPNSAKYTSIWMPIWQVRHSWISYYRRRMKCNGYDDEWLWFVDLVVKDSLTNRTPLPLHSNP